MARAIATIGGTLLIMGAGLLAAGCGGGSASPAAASGTAATASPAASTGTSTATNTGAAACNGGLTGTEPGVILVQCSGTARVRVQVGSSVTREFTGGTCASADGDWTMTDGVVTQKGVYTGRPVDVVSVNNQADGRGTIQLTLGGKVYFVDNASFALSDGQKAAHLQGITTNESDAPGTTVTVDVTC